MDLLGFVVVAAVLATQWPMVKAAFAVLPRFMHAGADAFGEACIMLKSGLVKLQLWVAAAALIFQIAFLYLTRGMSIADFSQLPPWYKFTLVASTVVMVLQLALAIWNRHYGAAHWHALPLTPDEIDLGVEAKRVVRMDAAPTNANPQSISGRSHPFAWMFLVGTTFLFEGMATQWHALLNEPYFQAQWLIGAGFICKMWYGFFALLVAAVISIVVRKGTRAIEVLSNIAAKLGLVWLPNITWENVQGELGGVIDLWDEDYIASLVDTLLLMAFLPFLPYDAAIFTMPHPIIAISVAATITVAGLATWSFTRTDALAQREGKEYLKRGKRLFFMLAPPWVLVATLIGAAWHASDEGQTFADWVENFRYGLVFLTHYSPLGYALIAAVAAVAFWAAGKGYAFLTSKTGDPCPPTAELDDTAMHVHGEAHGYRTPLRWLSYAVICGKVVLAVTMLTCLGMAAASCMSDTVRLRDPLQVGKRADLVLGKVPASPSIASETRELDFCTQKKAVGIVEFMDPKLAQVAGLPPYIYLTSVEDTEKCGGGYRHTAKIPESCLGPLPYRVVMRNDERAERAYWSPKTKSVYGSLTVFETQKPKLFPSKSSRLGFWEKLGSDFWFVTDPACRHLEEGTGGTGGSGGSGGGSGSSGGAGKGGSGGSVGGSVAKRTEAPCNVSPLKVDPEFEAFYGR